jgi:hypothetical protein
MAKQAYVYSGTDWVPLASEVTNLTGYQTKALNQFAHRNLIINGDMQIAQRGTSTASITASGLWTTDRWKTSLVTLGTWTMSQENDAPTGSGFRQSTKLLCTTADASPAAGDIFSLRQIIEGQNLQHIKKGTSAAEQLTISFWVKSNVTGTYIVSLYDADNTRLTGKSYTISTSATWEYKTLTFAADTTGAFDNDNAGSLFLDFGLAAGSTYTSGTLQSSWTTYADANFFVGQTNLASAISNYWQVTGVQLEVGNTATPFEFKSFEDELIECQRYYYRVGFPDTSAQYGILAMGGYTDSTTNSNQVFQFPTTMRSAPSSLTTSGTIRILQWGGPFTPSAYSLNAVATTAQNAFVNMTSSGMTGNSFTWSSRNNDVNAFIAFSSEL